MSYEKETQISEEEARRKQEQNRRWISHLSSSGINTPEDASSLAPEKLKEIQDTFLSMEEERRSKAFRAKLDAEWEKIKPRNLSVSHDQVEAMRKLID